MRSGLRNPIDISCLSVSSIDRAQKLYDSRLIAE